MDQRENKETHDVVQDYCCSPAEDTENAEHASEQTLNELKANLEACEVACSEWKDKFMHVSADLQNYRRRIEKEQLEWVRRSQAEVVLHMLPIVDDFDRAMLEHRKREHTIDFDEWLKGFELIAKGFHKFLQQMDIVEIKEIIQFDPHLHEAIVQIESDKHASGAIVDIIQKGYMFKGHVLRPAKVTVAK